MDPYVKRMLEMIDDLLAGRSSFDDFASTYYDFFLYEVPDKVLTNDVLDFFGAVQEKLDWTDKKPDALSRSYGWIDEEEFVVWLRKQRNDFPSAGGGPKR